MPTFPIGEQRIGILAETPGLELTELMLPASVETSVTWKDGCSFQVASATENESDTVTSSNMAEYVLPVDSDTRVLTSASVLRYCATQTRRHASEGTDKCSDCRDYALQADPFLEVDMRGREQYVFGNCERQTI